MAVVVFSFSYFGKMLACIEGLRRYWTPSLRGRCPHPSPSQHHQLTGDSQPLKSALTAICKISISSSTVCTAKNRLAPDPHRPDSNLHPDLPYWRQSVPGPWRLLIDRLHNCQNSLCQIFLTIVVFNLYHTRLI